MRASSFLGSEEYASRHIIAMLFARDICCIRTFSQGGKDEQSVAVVFIL